jgi:hypothetical protein
MRDGIHREAVREETRRIRRLQRAVAFAQQLIATQVHTKGEATVVIEGVRRYALSLFPDKGPVFDLIYQPRLLRVFRERFDSSLRGPAPLSD